MLSLIERDGWYHTDGRHPVKINPKTGEKERIRVKTGFRAPDQRLDAELFAAELWRKTLEEVKRGPKVASAHHGKTVGDALTAWEKMKRAHGGISTHDVGRVQRFGEWMGHIILTELKTADIEEVKTEKMRAGNKPGTVKRDLTILKAALNLAVDSGWIEKFPKWRMPTKAEIADERIEHLTHEDIPVFYEWVKEKRPCVYPAVVLLIEAGPRAGEARRVQRKHVDFRSGNIHFVKNEHDPVTKKQKTVPRAIQMSDGLLEVMKELCKGKGSEDFVLLDEGGQPWTKSKFGDAVNTLLRECCWEKKISLCRCHDLRHTFAYICGSEGMDLAELQYNMGHKSITQTVRYRGFIRSKSDSAIRRFKF